MTKPRIDLISINLLWVIVAFGYCQDSNLTQKEIAENFIKTGPWYTGYIEPLQFLANRMDYSAEEFIFHFKIRYGDGKEEDRYSVLKLNNKEVVEARLFYGYPVDYMLGEFDAGRLLNPDCLTPHKNGCYRSSDMFSCGGFGGSGCPDGYECKIKPCLVTDCMGVCKPIKKPEPKIILQPRIPPANAIVDTSSVIVDRLAHKVEFSLGWEDHQNFRPKDFYLYLRSPSGETITEDISDPQVEKIGMAVDIYAKGFRIVNPEAGVWEVFLEHPSGTKYTLGNIIWSDLKMDWNFVNRIPRMYEPIIIEARLYEPEPVTTATVTAVMRKYKLRVPDYLAVSNLVLLDNGTNNDRVAGDGIYTATFADTDTEGSYCVDVTAKGFTDKAGQFERNDSQCTVVSDRNPLTEKISEEELIRRRAEEQ